MEGFCRGCLIRYDDPMELLNYTEKYRRLFVYSTGLQVKRNDTITFQLCKDCFLNMKAACKFKKQCRSSDKKVKSFLALKDVGDGLDFCTFLKNNDDTMTFRLPLMSGSSTPANQKSREEDNESTCTSIRNFMTDILQGEEMPDTEARIIREVIEEEADVLEDSLDSHWLQDDASIDTDFRLDFSFSPFATPQSVNNDQYYTPKRQTNEQEQPKKYFTSISPARHHIVNDFTDIIKNNHSEKELCVFDAANVESAEYENNFEFALQKDNGFALQKDKVIDNLDMPIILDEDIRNSETPNSVNLIDTLSPPLNNNDKSINNLDLPIIETDKPISIDIPSINSEELINNLDLPSFENEKPMSNLDLPSLSSMENETSINNLDLPIIDDKNEMGGVENFYKPNDGSTYVTTSKEIERLIDDKVNIKKNKTCSIDKNLERALEDEHNKEYSLEDLLGTPRALVHESAASTPTIANILFGDELNINDDSNYKKEKIDKKDIDGIIDDFFQSDTKEVYSKAEVLTELKFTEHNMDVDEVDTGIKDKQKIKENLPIATEEQFDLENFFCNLCNKKFQSCKALLIHFNKKHRIKILMPPKRYKSKLCLCSVCGKELKHRKILHKHMKRWHTETKPEIFECDICSIQFATKAKIETHIRGHYGKPAKKNPGKFLCTICGASSTTVSNFRIHQKRHSNNYSHTCNECGRGFFRLSDLSVHMRVHTGEKPFYCKYCDRNFARKDFLTKHLKKHIDNRPYQQWRRKT